MHAPVLPLQGELEGVFLTGAVPMTIVEAIRAFQTMDLQSIKTGCEYTYPFRPNIETNFSQRNTAAVFKMLAHLFIPRHE
jgi:hypothetical protein